MATVLQFVDSIAASPTLRLNLNDGATWSGPLEGSDFSPPALKRAIADNILFDGATVAATAYENREITLIVDLVAANSDAKNTALRALHVELNREKNILKYQPGTSSAPVFFRTFRSPNYQLEEFATDGYTRVTINLYAEPFAYGLRVDVGPTTLTANPVVTNGLYVDVNSVTGDVETPALIKVAPGTGGGTGQPTWVSVRRHGTPSSLVPYLQAESATLGTDTTLTASTDATASGAGNNYVNVSFATVATLATRLTFTPNTAELAGTYRVLVRVKSGTTSTFTFGLVGGNTTTTYSTTVVAAWNYVDVGLVEFPRGGASQSGYSGSSITLDPTTTTLGIQIARTSGTYTLPVDLVLLLPADEEMTVLPTDTFPTGSIALILDGPNDTYYLQFTSTGNFRPWGPSENNARVGSIPKLQAGSNRLYVLPGGYTVTGTYAVTVSYWPRYLVV